MLGGLLALTLIAGSDVAATQPRTAVSGRVIDGITGEPLADVRVETPGRPHHHGPGGAVRPRIERPHHASPFPSPTGTSTRTSRSTRPSLKCGCFQTRSPRTVDVVTGLPGFRDAPEQPSATPVSSQQVFQAAGAVDNVFRTLDTLPGVAPTDDFGSRLSVRGGAPDQNLTMMDGVEIHNPYRLYGIASAFNPETVENFDLRAGGFGVQYGDRLSSLLIIDNRTGGRTFRGTSAASITDANVVIEGRTPGRARGSWLLSARRTYYDLVAGRLQDQNFPSFADVQLQADWEFGPWASPVAAGAAQPRGCRPRHRWRAARRADHARLGGQERPGRCPVRRRARIAGQIEHGRLDVSQHRVLRCQRHRARQRRTVERGRRRGRRRARQRHLQPVGDDRRSRRSSGTVVPGHPRTTCSKPASNCTDSRPA